MSEIISASNIDLVIQKNMEIAEEVSAQALKLQTNTSIMRVASMPQLALLILQSFGLIQMPIEDKYWSGAIYVKEGKLIPVINTALPRANQYFAAWHEIYHLLFDNVSFDPCMLLKEVDRYFTELPAMELVSKVLYCMSAFQAPYKAVLISLYENAVRSDNDKLGDQIKEIIDLKIDDIPERFRMLGLDDSLVMPSFVVNTLYLHEQIKKSKDANPELQYHGDNEAFLENIIKEIHVIMRTNGC